MLPIGKQAPRIPEIVASKIDAVHVPYLFFRYSMHLKPLRGSKSGKSVA